MKRQMLLAAAAIITLSWAADARAQYARPGPQTPAVSPMIGLAGRRSPAFNYFSTVQPVIENRALITRQAATISMLEKQRAKDEAAAKPDDLALRQTGHAAVFGNTSHYFPRR